MKMVSSSKRYFVEVEAFTYWPGMLAGIEFFPRKANDGFELVLGLTLFCCNLIYIEFCWLKQHTS